MECDEETGNVIGLDLSSSSCLYGSINSTSTLFHLVHLQRLNLADNHFNYSQIPASVGQFSGMTYLDLSASAFSGQVPIEISIMSNLSSLDLSENFLELKNPNMRSLMQNFTSLEILKSQLYNMLSGTIPRYLENSTSLSVLNLKNNSLHGIIPEICKNRGNLEMIDLSYNQMQGHLPCSLSNLSLENPKTICSFPSCKSLIYLTTILQDLESMDISRNFLSGAIPQQLSQLSFLSIFNVSQNNLIGPIPQGNQFNTFDNTSFEGNPGLCGALLSKKCDNSKLLPPPDSAFEKDDGDSVSQLKLDWKFDLVGYISGLVVGIVLSDFMIMRRHGRLVNIKRRRGRRSDRRN
nr:putative receptor like protein 25 [Ziziphus jujuba var. spinosa]